MTSFYTGLSGLGSDAPRGVMNGANGPNGHAFGPGGASPTPARPGGGRQFPHIDDLTRVVPDFNPLQPMKHLLDDAEKNYSQAEFLRSTGRIDLALPAFIKAFYVAVNVIPRNKEYNSLQNDRKILGDRYNRLVSIVNESATTYQAIKQTIKEDNARTGVQPKYTSRVDGAATNGRPATPSQVDVKKSASPAPSPITSPTRQKPAVQPKPANLHGNSIKTKYVTPSTSTTSLAQSDVLQQRLDKLRNTPKQDPRINTRPPLGMNGSTQSLPKLTTSLDGVMNMLPKVPDAIYSPARGSISNEAAELPSSTPRGMYSRANSVTGYFSAQAPTSQARSSEESYASLNEQRPSVTSVPKIKVALPKGDIITVDDLVKYQRIGSKDFSILLIDVRPRSEYEEGHILSAATICIEPEILQRPGIEAANVEDSMEVGSAGEKRLFEARHSFDLVVIYDQVSESLSSETADAPARLFSLLTDYDYPEGDPGSKHPKLLKGGLEAWQDAMGAGNLQKSSHRRRISAYDKHFLRSPTKPIQNAEEVRRWTQHLTQPKINDIDSGEDDAFSPVRSVNDFLTRFPPVQESMTSPVSPAISPRVLPKPDYPALPAEPKRPPPAVPRPSFTGLKPSDDDDGTPSRVLTKTSPGFRRAVGLQNPNNWCYANSVLQALFASGGFGHELFSEEWERLYKVPKKADEKNDPPQLMTKMVSNLFVWMGRGNGQPSAPPLKANLLMNYMQHVSRQRPNREIFGSNRQMDSHEFSRLLFTEIHDETNRVRDKEPTFDPVLSSNKCVLEGSVDCWNRYSLANDSIITKYWMGLELQIIVCNSCGFRITRAEECDHVVIRPPHRSPTVTMEQLLTEYYGEERLPDYKCDRCEASNSSLRRRLARLPDLFCVMFSRFEFNQGTSSSSKITTTIDFPHRDLDLTPYSIQGQIPEALLRGDGQPSGLSSIPVLKDHHFTGPFRYEAYAVVQHSGALVGGHYVAIVRDGPDAPDGRSQWHIADDATLRPHEVGPSRSDKGAQFLHEQRSGGLQAYMVFYQRKDGGLV